MTKIIHVIIVHCVVHIIMLSDPGCVVVFVCSRLLCFCARTMLSRC